MTAGGLITDTGINKWWWWITTVKLTIRWETIGIYGLVNFGSGKGSWSYGDGHNYSSNYPYHYQKSQTPIPLFLNAPKIKMVMKLVQ